MMMTVIVIVVVEVTIALMVTVVTMTITMMIMIMITVSDSSYDACDYNGDSGVMVVLTTIMILTDISSCKKQL